MRNKRQQKSENPTSLRMMPILVFLLGSILFVIVWSQFFRDSHAVPPVPKNLSTLDQALAKRIRDGVNMIHSKPTRPDPWGQLGVVYEAHEYNSFAMQCYETAINLDSSNPRWVYHIALLSIKRGNLNKAETSLRQVVLLKPDYAPAHERLGLLLFDLRDNDGAKLCFQRILSLSPKEPQGYIGLARIQLSQLEYASALELLIDAKKIAPDNSMVHYLLGRVYRLLGRRDEAELEFVLGKNAKSLYLEDPWWNSVVRARVTFATKWEAALALFDQGRVSEAITMFEQLLNQDPNNLKVVNNLAIAYLHSERMDDAQRLLNQALKKNPNYFPTHINLASVLLSQGDLSVALEHAEQATRKAPAVSEGYQVKGLVLAELGHFEEALVSFRHAQQLKPQNRDIYGFIAETLVKLQRWEEAIEAFKKAIEYNPQLGILHFKIGAIYSQNGQFNEAIKAFRAALALDPNNQGIARALEITERKHAGD